MNTRMLWNKDIEKEFFIKSLDFAQPDQLFYITRDNRYLAYWPKNYRGKKTTLQSRNAFIGSFTEKWASDLFSQIANVVDGYAIQKVICKEMGLYEKSPADIAICKTKDIVQKPQNIILIIAVKMFIVWNWELIQNEKGYFDLNCVGDYKTHQGNPGLLRSDTILKAIGKSINIRVSSFEASKIPIIILGNTPITNNYYQKVDNLKLTGIIQGFGQ